MSLSRFLGELWAEVFQTVKKRAFLSLAFVAFAVVGCIIGFAVFNLPKAYWWQCNRLDYASRLLYGGFFSVLISFACSGACLFLIAVLARRFYACKGLCWLGALLNGVYFGGVLLALFKTSMIMAILYCALVLSVQLAVGILSMLLGCCGEHCHVFSEAFKQSKTVGCVIGLSVLAQIIIVFLFLRIIILLI